MTDPNTTPTTGAGDPPTAAPEGVAPEGVAPDAGVPDAGAPEAGALEAGPLGAPAAPEPAPDANGGWSGPPSSPWPGQPTAAQPAPRKRSPALVIGIIVVLVAILGAVLYFTRNNVEANDLAVGTCFDVPNGDTVSTVTQHPCTEAHDAEVFSVSQYTAPDGTYPDSSAFDDYAATTCEPAFESYVGETIDASPYDVGYIFPSSDTWGNGDRQITCYATNVDGSKLSQSIKGSGSGSGTPASS